MNERLNLDSKANKEERYKEKISDLKRKIDVLLSDYFEIERAVEAIDDNTRYTHKQKGIIITLSYPRNSTINSNIFIYTTQKKQTKIADFNRRRYSYHRDIKNEEILKDLKGIKESLLLKNIFGNK